MKEMTMLKEMFGIKAGTKVYIVSEKKGAYLVSEENNENAIAYWVSASDVSTNYTQEEQEEDIKILKEEPKEQKLTVGDNQLLLSSLTNGELPTSGIDHVIQVYPDGKYEGYEHLIPEPDPDFIWNPDVLETLVLAANLKERAMLVGIPSSGKTMSCRQFCSVVRQPFYRVNGKEGVEIDSFVGSKTSTNGTIGWNDGPVTEACKVGGFLLIDECMAIPPGVQMVLQSLYEKGGTLTIEDKPGDSKDRLIVPDEDFCLILASNVCGTGDNMHRHSATMIQDTSFLSRIAFTCKVPHMPSEVMQKYIAKVNPKIEESFVEMITKLSHLTIKSYEEDGLPVAFDLRSIVPCLKLLELGFDLKVAVKRSYEDKLADDTDLSSFKLMWSTVFAGDQSDIVEEDTD